MDSKETILKKIEALKKKKHELEDISMQQDTNQHALKIFLNSAYGAFGSVYYPCFDLDNAEAITSCGRRAITEMVDYVNKLMNNLQGTADDKFVIAGDTDSINSDSVVTVSGKTVEELFNESIKHGISYTNGSNKSYVDLNIDEYSYSVSGKHSKIKTVSKHLVNKPKWRITVDGNSVEMTGDHSVMVYRNGKIIEAKPSEILNTDCLLVRKTNG